jgi:lipopolysaccharide transport system permease protein
MDARDYIHPRSSEIGQQALPGSESSETHAVRSEAMREIVIEAPRRFVPIDFQELWDAREILVFFIWRDIKVRYKQTILGGAWAILQPLLAMIIFTIIFGRLANIPSDGIPYPVFAYCALVPWMYFSNSLTLASNSLVQQERLITKVYFPRILVPVAAVVAGLVDLGIAFLALMGLQLYFGIAPGVEVIVLPLLVLLATATAIGVSLWLSALNVQYRDVRYVVPFLVQFWLFATPIAYPASLIPDQWKLLYGLNPMAGVVEGFRWALLGQVEPPWLLLAISTLMVFALIAGGLYYFRRMELTFADVV